MRDIASNVAGTLLTNTAATGFVIGGRAGQETDTELVEVVPGTRRDEDGELSDGDAGDVFTYTVTIAHAGNSSAAAFDLALADPLPSVLQPISVSSSVGTATLDGSTVRLAVPEFLIGDAPIVLTYVVRMTDAIQPGQQVPNLATLISTARRALAGGPMGRGRGARHRRPRRRRDEGDRRDFAAADRLEPVQSRPAGSSPSARR